MKKRFRITIAAIVGIGIVGLFLVIYLKRRIIDEHPLEQSRIFLSYSKDEVNNFCSEHDSYFNDLVERKIIVPHKIGWTSVHIETWLHALKISGVPTKEIEQQAVLMLRWIALCRSQGAAHLLLDEHIAAALLLKPIVSKSVFRLNENFLRYLKQIEIYQSYDKTKLEEFCADKFLQIHKWEDSGDIRFMDNHWRKISISEELFRGSIIGLENRVKAIMKAIALCQAKASVSVFRDGKKKVAHAILLPDLRIQPSVYIVSGKRRKEILAKKKEVKTEEKSVNSDTIIATLLLIVAAVWTIAVYVVCFGVFVIAWLAVFKALSIFGLIVAFFLFFPSLAILWAVIGTLTPF